MMMARKRTHEEKLQYVQELHVDCAGRWEDVSKYLAPGTQMNTIEARTNLFIDQLLEWEIITPEQKVDFEIKFAESIQDQLIEMRKQIDAQMAEANKPKLVMPNQIDPNALRALRNIGKS